jgi:hypothetical protein
MPIYKTLDDYSLILANKIIAKVNVGFIGAIIEGERGYGKSMYALKVMAQVYHNLLGISDDDAWRMALDYMLFSMDDVIKFIDNNIKNEIVTPVWTLDDATVHFCSYKFFTNLYEVILVHGMFDTIRTVCSSLLLTCPKRDLLLSSLRNYDDFKVEIIMDRGWERIARGYKIKTSPLGQRRIYKNYEDHYSCYVPDWIYQDYMKKRNFYLKQVNDELQKILANKAKKIELNEKKNEIKQFSIGEKMRKMQEKNIGYIGASEENGSDVGA